MNRLLFIIISLFVCTTMYAQKIEKVSATYTYYAPETMSIEEAKRTALERAKIQAIADKFGTTITQSTSTRVVNDGTHSNVELFSIGVNEVGGEWIETSNNPEFNVCYEDNMLVVRVSIKGKAREISRSLIPVNARVLRNGTEYRFESNEFKHGDDLFLSFQSPVDGNLLIYLIDYSSDIAYCLLPYSSSSEPSQAIQCDKHYTFFSEDYADYCDKSIVDQYTLTCSNPSGTDFNDIIIIFSPNTLVKSTTDMITDNIPRQIGLADFEKWKVAIQAKTTDIQIITKSIKKKK